MSNPHVQIVFDTSNMTEDQKRALTAAESNLFKAGIVFDSYVGSEGVKGWQWDFSLSGPIKLTIDDAEVATKETE